MQEEVRHRHGVQRVAGGPIVEDGRPSVVRPSRDNGARVGDAPGQVEHVRRGHSVHVSGLRVVAPAERQVARLSDGNEDLGEVEDADPVVSQAPVVHQRSREDVVRVRRTARAQLGDGVPRDDRVADLQVLHGVGVADRRRHRSREVRLAEVVGPRNAVGLVLGDRAAVDRHRAVRDVGAAPPPVTHAEQKAGKARRGLDEVSCERAVRELERVRVADPSAVGVDPRAVGEESRDPVPGERRPAGPGT